MEPRPFMLISCRTHPSSPFGIKQLNVEQREKSTAGSVRVQGTGWCVSMVQVVACSFCKWRFCLGVWAPTCQPIAPFFTRVTQPHLKIERTIRRHFIHAEGSSRQFYRRRLPSPSPDSGKLPCLSSHHVSLTSHSLCLQEPHHTV